MGDTSAKYEDDLSFSFPATPSELRTISDDELATTWRKLAFGSRHPFDVMVEREQAFRLVAALKDFKAAADRSSRTLNVLTVVLVVLTAVLLVYAIRGG